MHEQEAIMTTKSHEPGPAALSRRRFLKLGGAGLAGAALLPAAAHPRPAAPTELVFTFGPDDSGTLRALIDAFNARHSGQIRVTWREMSRESDAYYRQLESDFMADAADVDVIGGDVVWTAPFATRGWVRDLSRRFFGAYDPEDFLEAALNAAVYRFKVWGVPWYTDAGMLFYRKDLLQSSGFAGPPTTWDQLKQTAARVRRDARTRYGFVFQGAEYEGGVANALEYIWNAGGRVLTGNVSVAGTFGQSVIDPNVISVDSVDAARGLDTARSLVAEGYAPAQVTDFRELDALRVFLAGEAVFMRNWPYAYGILADAAQSRITPEQVGVAPLPAATEGHRRYSCLGGWNLMINARADRRKQEAAWTFIRFAVEAAQQKRRALDGGFLPSLRRLYDDPEILARVPVIAQGRQAVADARVRLVSPYYMQMAPRIARAFNRVLRGDVDGAGAVRALQAELQTILRKNR